MSNSRKNDVDKALDRDIAAARDAREYPKHTDFLIPYVVERHIILRDLTVYEAHLFVIWCRLDSEFLKNPSKMS